MTDSKCRDHLTGFVDDGDDGRATQDHEWIRLCGTQMERRRSKENGDGEHQNGPRKPTRHLLRSQER